MAGREMLEDGGQNEGGSVRQGFICPFCLDDLGDFESLQAHVERSHPDGFEGEEDTIDHIKRGMSGILSHARKIKSTASSLLDRPSTSGVTLGTGRANGEKISPNSNVSPVEKRGRILLPKAIGKIGCRRSLMELFREERDSSVNESAVRTNMLIIRLDRLINDGPADPSNRKEFERSIVPWTSDSSCTLCSSCAAKFSLTRRRHHCRLCGIVMCSNCSRYLSFLSARKLTNPALAAQMLSALGGEDEGGWRLASLEAGIATPSTKSATQTVVGLAKKSSGQLLSLMKNAMDKVDGREDGEDGSVTSLQSQDAAEHLRVCPSCIGFLGRREAQMEQANPPAFVSQYEQLKRMLTEVSNLVPSYARTAESLRNGETMYTLSSTEELRRKLVMKQKEVDILSKKIADDFDETTVGRDDANVRKRIRAMALLELQENMIALPPLPTPEEYTSLVEKRKAEVARQIAENRMKMAEAERDATAARGRLSSSPSLPSMQTCHSSSSLKDHPKRERESLVRSSSTMDDGWTPEQKLSENPFVDEEHQEHAYIVQRKMIKSFLQQAAQEGQLDNARILEENLRQIEEEIVRLGIETPRDQHSSWAHSL